MELTEHPNSPSMRSELDASGARYITVRFVTVPPAFSGRFAFHPAEPPLISRVALPRIPFSPRTIPRCPKRTHRRSTRIQRRWNCATRDPRESTTTSTSWSLRRRTSNGRSPRHRTSSIPEVGRRVDRDLYDKTRVYPVEIRDDSRRGSPYHARIRCRENDLNNNVVELTNDVISALLATVLNFPTLSRADRRPTD